MKRTRLLALIATTGVFLAFPTQSLGEVTIGSNLQRPTQLGLSCLGGPCTFALHALDDPSFAAPGGVSSPVNGTVTGWRVRAGSSTTSTTLRIVRQLGGNLFTGAGTSTAVTPPVSSTSPTYPTQLPIRTGDLIGINCCDETVGTYFRIGNNETHQWFAPGLADGGTGEPPDDFEGELLLQASIEPTAAFTIGAVKSGKGGKLTVTATLPNPGTLEGGDKNDASLATAAGKKKSKYLQRASMPVGVANQTIRILLKPTKRARSVLARKGKLKTKAKLVFTPTGGSPSTQIIKAKLKR